MRQSINDMPKNWFARANQKKTYSEGVRRYLQRFNKFMKLMRDGDLKMALFNEPIFPHTANEEDWAILCPYAMRLQQVRLFLEEEVDNVPWHDCYYPNAEELEAM